MRSTPIIRTLALTAALGLVACTQPQFFTGPNSPATLRLDAGTGLIHRGESIQLRAVSADPTDRVLSPDLVIWGSSSPNVATVSATGVVQGVGLGSAQISAIYGGESAVVSIGVIERPVCAAALVPQGCPLQ